MCQPALDIPQEYDIILTCVILTKGAHHNDVKIMIKFNMHTIPE
jgi:hypothetical protein